MVFQTAPPQPASNARWTCAPEFAGGAEASQNGFGESNPREIRCLDQPCAGALLTLCLETLVNGRPRQVFRPAQPSPSMPRLRNEYNRHPRKYRGRWFRRIIDSNFPVFGFEPEQHGEGGFLLPDRLHDLIGIERELRAMNRFQGRAVRTSRARRAACRTHSSPLTRPPAVRTRTG